MSRLGTVSLANASLSIAILSPQADDSINSRVNGSLSPGSQLHIFLALRAPSKRLCPWKMQAVVLNLLNASSKQPSIEAGQNVWPGVPVERQQKARQFLSSIMPVTYCEDLKKRNKGLFIEFLLANDEIPKCCLYLWPLNELLCWKQWNRGEDCLC